MRFFQSIKHFFFGHDSVPALAAPQHDRYSSGQSQTPLHKRSVLEEQAFYLETGQKARTISELRDLVEDAPDEVIHKHLHSGHNDFALWVYDCLHATSAASIIRATRTKPELIHVLNELCR